MSSKNLKKITCSRLPVQVCSITSLAIAIVIYELEDIVERFTLALMLFAIAFRNLVELSGSEFDADGVVLPKSFGWFRGGNLLWTIFYVSFYLCFAFAMAPNP